MNKAKFSTMLKSITVIAGIGGIVATNLTAGMEKASFSFGMIGDIAMVHKRTTSSPSLYNSSAADNSKAIMTGSQHIGQANAGSIVDSTTGSPTYTAMINDKSYYTPLFSDARGSDGETMQRPLLGVGLCAGFAYPLSNDIYVGVDLGFILHPSKSNNVRSIYKAELTKSDSIATAGATSDIGQLTETTTLTSIKNRYSGHFDFVVGMRRGLFMFVGGNFASIQTLNNYASDAVSKSNNVWGLEFGLGTKVMLAKNLSLSLSAGYTKRFTEFSETYKADTSGNYYFARRKGVGMPYNASGLVTINGFTHFHVSTTDADGTLDAGVTTGAGDIALVPAGDHTIRSGALIADQLTTKADGLEAGTYLVLSDSNNNTDTDTFAVLGQDTKIVTTEAQYSTSSDFAATRKAYASVLSGDEDSMTAKFKLSTFFVRAGLTFNI